MAALLIALAIGSSIAVAMAVEKQWYNRTAVYTLDTTGSQIVLDSATGTATITIVLHNTGSVVAYIGGITIIQNKVQVNFVDEQAWITGWGVGSPTEGNTTFSSANAFIGDDWVTLPPQQSVYITFSYQNMNQLMQPGNRYVATIIPFNGGNVMTFSLTVQSD